VIEEFRQHKGPDFVLLDMIKSEEEGIDRFGPVPFDHLGHAKWAELSGGCLVCHHYTPEGSAHPACGSCHIPSLKREDITMPSLKGAYHRQCMGCHREWSHTTRCDVCHVQRIGQQRGVITREDALGHMTPPIPAPETEIYEPESRPSVGTKVIFRHGQHTRRFGLKCAECHRGDSCTRCHEEGKTHVQVVRVTGEHHQDCSLCHAADTAEGGRCDVCHWNEGQPEPPPFQHASTGWPLHRYHEDKSCRVCHEAVPFAKVDRNCTTCHADWKPDSFDHAITGQQLDENHAEIDCEECHIDRRFDRAPTCEECHEEEEATFPAKRPGPVVESDGT
jgi:hypothetical protein